jgi:hypothetical protein
VRYIALTGAHGPAAARNAGWRGARGAILAFTDDDCIPDPGWLRAGLSAFTGDVAGADGTIVVPLPERPTDYQRDTAGLAGAEFATANCFYRRDVLAAVGGFDERFSMAWREDSDLFFALLERGYEVARARRGGGSPRTASRLGREPAPAAQKHVQCAALPEAPNPILAADSAGAAVGLLCECRRAAGRIVRRGAPAAARADWRRALGAADHALLRAAAAPHLARAQTRRRDARDFGAHPAAGDLLARARRDQVSGVVPIRAFYGNAAPACVCCTHAR